MTARTPIFDYLDYRHYLRDACTARKEREPSFTFRYIADQTGIDSGYVAKIFQSERHISPKLVDPFITLLALDDREAEYFRQLHAFCKARTHQQKDRIFNTMLAMNQSGRSVLAADQYELFAHWYNLAVREIIAVHPFAGDYTTLAKQLSPRITASQARHAIRLLEELRLIRLGSGGIYEKINPVLTTGENTRSLAVITCQKSLWTLARDAYDRFDPDDRHMSTLTLSLSKPEFDEIVTDIQNLRAKILEKAKNCVHPDRVINCGFAVFPLSEMPKHEVSE